MLFGSATRHIIMIYILGPNDLTEIDETLLNPLVVKLVKLVSRKKDVTVDAVRNYFNIFALKYYLNVLIYC